ncbi:helix-turn-helix domain-containing protein [Nocardioides sp. ChNu-99]|uniref:helix-turn-helix domain-containing protein n=1 Tax=Nocardioides sp. ChNu-99 TaxID=2839897 RepID=UPI00240748A0|nr:helix-turn-helix domain-containing protein [Nocardioides sp. ChNu-99]MDF9717883.1 helix-turn-helix domain-containing protein [Nocardioides sp. ChNu-99]
MTTAEAAVALGVSRAMVVRRIQLGELTAVRHRERWWIDPSSLEDLVAREAQWVSIGEAARLAGCTRGRVLRAVTDGTLSQRPGTRASIARGDVDALRRLVDDERAAAERRRRAAEAAESARAAGPPDAEHRWYTTEQAAGLLGCSSGWVRLMVAQERLPATRVGARNWIREGHLLQRIGAQAFLEAAAHAEEITPP